MKTIDASTRFENDISDESGIEYESATELESDTFVHSDESDGDVEDMLESSLLHLTVQVKCVAGIIGSQV